ncbi:NAD-dependent epimerase/dehydratase family protein [Rubrobacter aplysinae]|uniref:NAD-dependent epimerase/dehydratase family protein n=1 Tax=Rubrobacter aplysinae TaxID=909625 RepID=UPI00064C22ED|nr:NAD-dependent epimerase/dehydratase family protein [Rubrobacter aplysinae]
MITGATGYVGSAVAAALDRAGYEVCGLARSRASAQELRGRGYAAYPGDMKRPGDLSRAILESGAGAVVHAATTGDSEAEEADRNAVEDALRALRGTGRTFVYTSGGWVMGETPGSPQDPLADEETPPEPAPSLHWRPAVERWVLEAAASHGVSTFVVRPALVYGGGGGVVAELVQSARERGSARYVVGDAPGSGPLWTLVHRGPDLGDLYARILARAEPDGTGGSLGTLVVAAGTSPVPVREIAAEASLLYGSGDPPQPLPLSEARRELGVYADSLVLSQRLSGARARRLFCWEPSGPPVLEELATGSYAPPGSSEGNGGVR